MKRSITTGVCFIPYFGWFIIDCSHHCDCIIYCYVILACLRPLIMKTYNVVFNPSFYVKYYPNEWNDLFFRYMDF